MSSQFSKGSSTRSSMTFSSAGSNLSSPPCNSSPAPILLASASPRRAHILQTLGIPFRVVSSAFQEPPPRPEDHAQPARYVEYLAREKGRGCGD
ncbi:MAG TPA: Maf family protein, partial [Abditibacteriaceae bacterium]|nr:Maf family protein [Abditibacteriaceae bacterium]